MKEKRTRNNTLLVIDKLSGKEYLNLRNLLFLKCLRLYYRGIYEKVIVTVKTVLNDLY